MDHTRAPGTSQKNIAPPSPIAARTLNRTGIRHAPNRAMTATMTPHTANPMDASAFQIPPSRSSAPAVPT